MQSFSPQGVIASFLDTYIGYLRLVLIVRKGKIIVALVNDKQLVYNQKHFLVVHWTLLYRHPPGPSPHAPPQTWELIVQASPLDMGSSDIWWPSLETCSNLFTLGPLTHQC